jgi:hypothetical protein
MSKARILANLLSTNSSSNGQALPASKVNGLATVATSGSYNDLGDRPGAGAFLPAQANNVGEFLKTDGITATWEAIPQTTYATLLKFQ